MLLHGTFWDSMHLCESFFGNLPYDPCKMTPRLHNELPFIYDAKFITGHSFKRKEIVDNFSLSARFKFLVEKQDGAED